VNVSSVIGETGNIGQVNYAASKSGLFGLTKSLAREAIFQLNKAGRPPGDGLGVTVNAVTPGFIATDMLAGMPDKALERVRGQIPVGTARPGGRDRPGGLLPRRRRVCLHYRADLGGQRRPGHVRRPACLTSLTACSSPPRSRGIAAIFERQVTMLPSYYQKVTDVCTAVVLARRGAGGRCARS
jgi:hypothetical protein